MTKPRVLLADDHTMLLEAFRKLLADECEVVGCVSNGRELLEEAARLRPDVAVVDISMPLLNGLDAARQLKRAHPDVRIIFLTMNEDPDLAAESFRAGASGYLLKRSAGSELLVAIQEAMKQRAYVTPLMTAGLMGAMMEKIGQPQPINLSARQREVIQLIAEGRSIKETASVLNISPRTVAFHKYRVMEQLHLKTTAALIQYAVKHHFV
jgi:DNA-binding NarL/FixJ family response regulator